jgi:hypothetical protein
MRDIYIHNVGMFFRVQSSSSNMASVAVLYIKIGKNEKKNRDSWSWVVLSGSIAYLHIWNMWLC